MSDIPKDGVKVDVAGCMPQIGRDSESHVNVMSCSVPAAKLYIT